MRADTKLLQGLLMQSRELSQDGSGMAKKLGLFLLASNPN
jgi:hypothetical protein